MTCLGPPQGRAIEHTNRKTKSEDGRWCCTWRDSTCKGPAARKSFSHEGPSKRLHGSGAQSAHVRSVPSQEPSEPGLEPSWEASSLQRIPGAIRGRDRRVSLMFWRTAVRLLPPQVSQMAGSAILLFCFFLQPPLFFPWRLLSNPFESAGMSQGCSVNR